MWMNILYMYVQLQKGENMKLGSNVSMFKGGIR